MRKFSFLLLAMIITVCLATMAFAETEPTKWQPQYGEKGELLNPEPSISFYRTTSSIGNSDYPVIATDVLTEDFESAWSSGAPPTGWTIIDNGTEGSQCWYTDDPMKYYYSTWSDTVCRTLYYSGSIENNYDEWVITPTIDFGTAAACTLFWKEYYNNGSATADTAFVLGSIDDGANWTDTIRVYVTDTSNPKYDTVDISGWAAGQSQVKIAFRHAAYGSSIPYYWYIDKVAVDADGSQLWLEDFNNWGLYGNNPPAGWTMIDNGTPKPAEGPWNVNDWYKYTSTWSSGTARIYYTSTYKEYQDEWLISPTFALSSNALCSLKVAEYFYHSSSAPNSYCYILVSTDGGTTWSDTLATHSSTVGSSSSKTIFAYDMSSYSGQSNLQVAFNYTNDPSGYSYWVVDDFLVEEFIMASDDVVTTSINSPTMAIQGYDWDINTTVTNLGSNTATFDDSTYIYQIVKTSYLFENFEGDWGPYGDNPPTGWTILDYGDEATPTWNTNDWYKYYYTSTWGNVAAVRYTPVENQDEWLITPAIDLSGASANIFMTFHSYFNNSTSDPDSAYILGSIDGGTTWTDTLAFWNVSHTNENPVFDITSWAANQSNVKIAFVYYAYDALLWYVDDVEVFSLAYPPATYVSGETVTGLTSLETRDVAYSDTWDNPDPSDYIITSFTALGADADNSNDTLTSIVTSYPHFGSGGPDDAYYSWEDNITGSGNAFNWYDISSTGTPVNWDAYTTGDDRRTSGISMGISFFYYGNTYDRIFISENGFASFDTITAGEYGNTTIPSTSGQGNILALLWDDLKAGTGTAYYQAIDYDSDSDTEFIIQFDNWQYLSSSLNATLQMQMILDPTDNSIIFQYNQSGPDYGTYTVGIENAAEDVGLLYYYYSSSTTNTNHPGNSALPGLAITFTYNPPQIDGTITSIDVPADGDSYLVGETFTPTVTIGALGDDSFTAQVTCQIYDATQTLVYNQTETSGTVPGQGSLQHAFATDYTITDEGTFDVVAFVVVSMDANNSNDTLTSDFDANLHYSEGGPDDYGYRFIDNVSFDTGLDLPPPPTFNWIDIAATGDTIGSGSGNTGYSNPVNLGFDFSFYGTTYSSFYVLGYGYITFGNYYNTYGSNYCMPYSSTSYDDPTIALFWDSGYPSTTYDGYVFAQTFGDAPDRYTVVQYQNYRVSSQNLNFEVILRENGEILIQYLDVYEGNTTGQGQSATVGIESENGLAPARSGLNYECNGDPAGNLVRDSLAVLFYYYQPAIDPVMVSVDAPSLGEVGTETFPVVTIKNNGTSATTMDVTVKIVDPSLTPPADTVYSYTETTPSVDPLAEYQYTFTNGWTPASSGTFTILASVYVAGDEFTTNNDAQGSAIIYDSVIDFEADNGGLIATNDWEWGTPANNGPSTAHSGSNCWGTVIDGLPTLSTISDLDFQIEITGANPEFDFFQWYYGSTSSYYYRIFVDDGSGYVQLEQWQGSNQAWNMHTVDLSAYTGIIKMRLQLETGTYIGSYAGWYVDDFGFVGCELFVPDYDVEVVSIDSPSGYLSGGETYDIVATIKNNGLNTVTFDVDAFDNHTYSSTQTVTDLGYLETTQVTFTGWTVSSCSTYTLTVASDLTGDEVTDNDTLTADYLTLPTYNTVGQYDDGVPVSYTRFVDPENVIANQFNVPYQGSELSAIGFIFDQDGQNDTVEVYLFLDSNDDGLPDTIPAYSDTIVRAGYGETMWLIGCGVTPVTIDCESFWAGWSLVDTVVAGNEVRMAIDNTNDFGMGWGLWRDETSGELTWNPWNSTSDGDNMIRAYYDVDPSTAPAAMVDPSAIIAATDPGLIYTDSSSVSNTVTFGCDLDYTVSVKQVVAGMTAGDQDRGTPMDWVASNDKSGSEESIKGETDGKVPLYPPMTLDTGGPDAYGYTWKDSNEPSGPTYGWIDISTLGTEISWPSASDSLDDQVSGPLPLGMTFNFYGVDYSEIYISTNGWASFLSQSNSYLSDGSLPNPADPNALLAVYWDDLEGQYPTGTYGSAYYYYDATENQFILSWTNWHHYSNSIIINFQIILDADDNTVTYQYSNTFPTGQTDYTIGMENADGTAGLTVSNNQSYVADNLAVRFSPPPTWLSTDLVDGSVAAGGTVPFHMFMDATDLDCGFYHGAIVINSNDPVNPSVEVDVQLSVGSNLSGTVTDANGDPLEGVQVDVMDGVTLVGTDNTDIDGNYAVVCFNGGTYQVNFFKTGYYDAQAEVTFAIGESETQDMTLNSAGNYTGTVTDYYDTPLADVHVWAEIAPMRLATTGQKLSTNQLIGQSGLSKMSHNIKKDFSNIGTPEKADNVEQIRFEGYEAPLLDAEYCDIVLGGTYIGGYNGQVTGLESWAVFQDPSTCALTPTYPYQVYAAMFSLQNMTGITQQVDFTISIYAADMDVPSCPTITGDPLYVSAPHSVILQSPYVYRIGDFPVNVIVNGPYFVSVDITSDNSANPLGWPVSGDAGTSCVCYNNYGSGWYDVVADYGYQYNPVGWWHTQGFSTTADNIVSETWTDADGEYTLVLDPGDYVVHYDTTGWNSYITDPFTLNVGDAITAETVIMRRPGSLSGLVEDESGALENVHVTVDDGQRTIIGEDYTDEFGNYSIANIYDGDYTISFILDGYETIVISDQHINDGQALVIDQTMVTAGFAYLPGDANMYNGAWPPAVIGSDVTYLVNFFRGLESNPACNIEGFYMSADVNASCTIIGSDVTRLVNFFRGSGVIEYCPDWEPLWHNTSELPDSMPEGWPNCDPPIVTGELVVPSPSSTK